MGPRLHARASRAQSMAGRVPCVHRTTRGEGLVRSMGVLPPACGRCVGHTLSTFIAQWRDFIVSGMTRGFVLPPPHPTPPHPLFRPNLRQPLDGQTLAARRRSTMATFWKRLNLRSRIWLISEPRRCSTHRLAIRMAGAFSELMGAPQQCVRLLRATIKISYGISFTLTPMGLSTYLTLAPSATRSAACPFCPQSAKKDSQKLEERLEMSRSIMRKLYRKNVELEKVGSVDEIVVRHLVLIRV